MVSMNLAMPHTNAPELILYIWKIIDLPSISKIDLAYKISFEMCIMAPNKAEEFINRSIDKRLLKKENKDSISLSQDLAQKLKKWQIDMRNNIRKKINSLRKIDNIIDDFENVRTSDFNTLLKSFLDKGTINRAATISDKAFQLNHIDYESGIIKAKVKGTKEEFYNIEINSQDKTIIHNCHDFETNRSRNKRFCKHLAKFFLLFKEKNEKSAGKLLIDITQNINDWEFTA